MEISVYEGLWINVGHTAYTLLHPPFPALPIISPFTHSQMLDQRQSLLHRPAPARVLLNGPQPLLPLQHRASPPHQAPHRTGQHQLTTLPPSHPGIPRDPASFSIAGGALLPHAVPTRAGTPAGTCL